MGSCCGKSSPVASDFDYHATGAAQAKIAAPLAVADETSTKVMLRLHTMIVTSMLLNSRGKGNLQQLYHEKFLFSSA